MRAHIIAAAAFVPVLALVGDLGAKDAPLPEPRVELEKDRIAKTKTGGSVLLKGATVLPVTGPRREGVDILVRDGKIREIGKDLEADESIARIDCKGRFISPGAIDCHSHIAIHGPVNEMTEKMSSEVRIADVIDPKDVDIFRAIAGGTTAAHLLHGSGNPIGGQSAAVKLKWMATAKEMLIEDAPRGIKFALGENPTRMEMFPRTRMGMVATYRRAFTEGRAYAETWRKYREAKSRNEDPAPPRRDLRLETLAEILEGKVRIHCHSYRADEIVAFLGVCDEFGVKVATLQHVLEGYKVAAEIARHGAGCSTFSDWWAYKVEVMDAIPANAAICTRAGVLTSINSDSGELDRHLFLEAAKSVRYGGLNEEETLSLVTINPAKQLGIDRRTGSIEVGKDADLVVWNGHPLSAYSHPVLTLIEGEVVFERPEGPRPVEGKDALPAPASFTIAAGADTRPVAVPVVGDEFAIVGARIEPVSSPPYDGGTILVRKGRIAAIGTEVVVPRSATVLEGRGLVVTPGFIEAGSSLGLVEVESLKVTRDFQDSGEFQPDLVALGAVHPASEHIGVSRVAGLTASLALPRGGLIPGQASVIRLEGWTAAELDVKAHAGLVIEFPSRPAAPPEGGPRPRKFDRRELLEKFFEKARDDMERRERARGTPHAIPPEPRLEALAPYLRRERPVLFVADQARTILDAIAFAEEQKVKPVIVSAKEAWKVASVLAAKDVPVIYGPVLDVPSHEWDPYDAAYAAPAVLANAGVRFAIRCGAFMAGPRNLPFEAAMAASYGLGRDRALAAITRAPAEILGLEGRGTLEPGKVADLVVSTGDPLEPTSRVRHVFIEGKPVSLETKQSRLEAQARARLAAVQKR